MNEDQFGTFLSVISWVCAVGAVINILMVKKRGLSGYFMGGSFLCLGGALTLYKIHAPTYQVAIVGALVVLLLIADLIYRGGPRK